MTGAAPRRKGSVACVACPHPRSSTRGGESGPSFGASFTVTSTSWLLIADERVFCQVSLPRSMVTNADPLRGLHVEAQHRSHRYPARLDLNSSLALPRVPYDEGDPKDKRHQGEDPGGSIAEATESWFRLKSGSRSPEIEPRIGLTWGVEPAEESFPVFPQTCHIPKKYIR